MSTPGLSWRVAQAWMRASTGLAPFTVVVLVVVLSVSKRPILTVLLGAVVAGTVALRRDVLQQHALRPRHRAALAGARTLSEAPSPPVSPAPAGRLPLELPVGSARPATIPALEVRWWRRDGHDRLYVTDGAGTSLGWLDRETGTLQVLDEQHRDGIEHALCAVPVAVDQRSA